MERLCEGLMRLSTSMVPQTRQLSVGTAMGAMKGRWHDLPKYVTSHHRSRPPTQGIHRHTVLRCVDNSVIGKQAMLSGRPPYCIWTYKGGYSKRHMPKARLGDKILVAVRGEMRKAYVVGDNTHHTKRQMDMLEHGIPSFDTNNVVLVDEKLSPIGNRVLAPIPASLKGHRDPNFAKIVAIATKFV